MSRQKPAEFVASSCEGKDRLTARQAHRIARRMASRNKVRVEAYRCDICGHYHVGRPASSRKG